MNRPLRGFAAMDVILIHLVRQSSVVKKSPSPVHPSHRVTRSEAKGRSRSAESSFAKRRMTGLTLSVGEDLSRSFEPCLTCIIWPLLHTSSDFLEFFTRESSH